MAAIVFGEISPKIKINSVRIPVAIPAPTLPHKSRAREVAMEDAERLTILFPIKIALNILPESSVTLSTHAAREFPSSARERIRFTVVSAVSAEEKNAESKSRMIKIII